MSKCPHCFQEKPLAATHCPSCTHHSPFFQELGFNIVGQILSWALLIFFLSWVFGG